MWARLVVGLFFLISMEKKYPEVIPVLLNNGMQCIGCHVATWETLEQAAQSHGIDIKQLLKDLNKEVEKNEPPRPKGRGIM